MKRNGLIFVAGMATLMWVVEILDAILPGAWERYGIVARDADRLVGILLAPFLHTGFGHLIANTIPFVVLGGAIALSGLARIVAVTAVVGLTSGAAVWLLAPDNSVTVGTSGLVFGYATYLLARWFFDRRPLHLVVGIVVALVWGTVLLGGLLPTPGVSWQAHLFGAVGGVLAAKALAGRGAPRIEAPQPAPY